MAITREQARTDLEKVMARFETLGPGTENDRAAQLVMQTIGVLERRLGSPEVIKMLYMDNPEAAELLPPTVYEVAQGYIDGSIDEDTARAQLQDASKRYAEVFQEMGITPQPSMMGVFR